MRLTLTTEEGRFAVRIDRTPAPRTCAALLACLPARIDFHTARIAGQHVFWHAPFVEPPEADRDVLTVPPGAFLYWPERQFLELVYGALQAEAASVTLLGMVEGDLEPLRRLGRRVREEQGLRACWGRLAADGRHDQPPLSVAEAQETVPPGLAALRRRRERIWQAPPTEIAALMARRGLMLPAGPLLMAEAEARKLHELLWPLLWRSEAGEAAFAGDAAVLLLDEVGGRLADLCGLPDSAGTLRDAAAALRTEPAATAALIREAILFAGRLAGWLDLRIPWDRLNAATLAAAAQWA